MRLGQSVRLASVRCLTFASWRKDSRRRMQAGEFRLGTVSMYMSTNMPIIAVQINKKPIIYMATFSSLKSPDLSIEAIQRTIVRSNFRLNKGEARNALARAVFFNRQGELRDRTFENQRYRASGLNLVVLAIILWNTMYLERAF